jgi:hypothetical protein
LAESDFTYLILLKLLLPCYFSDHDMLAVLVYNLIKLGLGKMLSNHTPATCIP